MAQRNSTPEKKPVWIDAFLQHLSLRGNVTESCEVCGIDRSTPYRFRDANSWFAELWEEADQKATDRLIAEGWRRAQEGVDKPIYYKGERVDTVKEYSDTLLIFLAKARDPEKYRERYDMRAEVKVEGADYIKELLRIAKEAGCGEPPSDT